MWGLLLVDDEEIIREGLRDGIDWPNLSVRIVGEARNGYEALKKVETLHPDIILADVVMPGMDGLAFVQRLRETGDRTHVIFLSAHQKIEYLRSAIKASAVDYLPKPVDVVELQQTMCRVITELEKTLQAPNQVTNLSNILKAIRFSEKSDMDTALLPEHFRIREIIKVIESCYHRNISLNDIADTVGLSISYMDSLFKKETGKTVHTYLSDVRMVKAVELLTDPSYRIYEVAGAVGFSDPNYFSRVFKKHTGRTPGEFRENLP